LERGLVVGGLITGGLVFFYGLSKLGEKRLKKTEEMNSSFEKVDSEENQV
jgi:hypothetical protein